MYNQRRPTIQRELRELPKTFPTGQVYTHPDGSLDFQVADLVAFLSFKKNVGGMERSELKRIIDEKGGEIKAVLTAEDLKLALRSDASWRDPFVSEKDGKQRRCGFCTKPFDPMTGPEFKRNDTVLRGGSFGIVKWDFIEKRIAGAKPEMAERVRQAGKEFTAEVVAGGDFNPVLAFAIPTCETCREPFEAKNEEGRRLTPVTFVRFSSVIPALAIAEQNLNLAKTVAESQDVLSSLIGGPRPARQHGNRATGGGVHREDREDRRPYNRGRSDFRDDRVDWHGAMLRQATAAALTAAGYDSLNAAIAVAESGELTAKGIANERSLGPITDALKRGRDGRTDNRPVAGEAAGAVIAPGAQPPSEEATSVRARPRSQIVRGNDKPAAKPKPAGKTSSRRTAASVNEALA